MPQALAPLNTCLTERLQPAVRPWWGEAFALAARGLRSPDLLVRWSACGRKLGRTPLVIAEDEARGLKEQGATVLPNGWGADELGRALLLLRAAEVTPEGEVLTAVDDLFRTGEMREQQAVLRVLAALPGAERFAPLAADAVRSNVLSVLEALACDNPFPARHMPDLAFNHMIMKALFSGLSLTRVVGLDSRLNDELRRMTTAWASERRAAGRPVPADVDLVIGGPHP